MITVSVSMITYNHEKYLKKSIEGVLMQQVDFPMELIISNDNSTDKTDEIINDVIENYHGNIKIRYYKHQENKGATENFIWTISQAKGKYIAICDGDDYWIDPYKLQKQVDFMEKNPDVVICGTKVKILDNINNRIETPLITSLEIKKYECKDIFEKDRLSTRTVLFYNINDILDKKALKTLEKIRYTDKYLWLFLLYYSGKKAAILPFVSAVYNKHQAGIYAGASSIARRLNEFRDRIAFLSYILSYGPNKFMILNQISQMFYWQRLITEIKNLIVYIIYIFLDILYFIKLKSLSIRRVLMKIFR